MQGTTSIGTYTTSGTTLNASLVISSSALGNPFGMALAGTSLYVTNYGSRSVSEFTATGGTVADPLISEAGPAYGVVVSGDDLLVAHGSGAVRRYSRSGALLDNSFITVVGTPVGLALADGYIYVTDYSAGTVGKYTTSGSVVDASLLSGLVNPYAIAVSGTDMYVTSYIGSGSSGTVGKYTTTGGVIDAELLSGFSGPFGVAVAGEHLYVTDYVAGTIGKFTSMGGVVNAALVSGLDNPTVIVVAVAVPEVAGTPLGLAGVVGVLVMLRRAHHKNCC